MELDGSGNRVLRYAYQPGIDQPVAVTTSSGTFYYYLDQEGNVISVWNSSNTKVAEYKYDPYGYQVASSGSLTQPLRWKGRGYDAETGLIYMRARYYDPTVGRFISEDPIGLEGGINPYTFADGEPVNRADPSGMECLEWGGFRAVEVSPGHTVYYAKCTNYQLEAITSTAYAPIGFKSVAVHRLAW
jgi:RHS repeat-associated protein